MASKKQGFVVVSPERKKHLKVHKRQFWKAHRKAETVEARKETD